MHTTGTVSWQRTSSIIDGNSSSIQLLSPVTGGRGRVDGFSWVATQRDLNSGQPIRTVRWRLDAVILDTCVSSPAGRLGCCCCLLTGNTSAFGRYMAMNVTFLCLPRQLFSALIGLITYQSLTVAVSTWSIRGLGDIATVISFFTLNWHSMLIRSFIF